MIKNFIEFDGGETPLPEKIRDFKTLGNYSLTPSTKFVYLAIKWAKGVLSKKDKRFDPSYLFMKKRFGISANTYNRALRELQEINAIDVTTRNVGGKKYLIIDLKIKNDEKSERIPSVIITTEVLTVYQKLFLSLLWKILYVDGNSKTISTLYSSYKIANALESIGISKRSTYIRLSELSDSDSGFVNIINMHENEGLSINMKAIYALWQYEDDLWTPFKMLGGRREDYHIYKKPNAGDFNFDGKKIIKND